MPQNFWVYRIIDDRASTQQAVWRQSECMLAENLVGI